MSFVITNKGPVAGSEIAQVYVGMKDSRIFRSARELKGFAKVYLKPGESRAVTVTLDDKAFSYFNINTGRFEIESGSYSIQAGASAEDIRLSAEMKISGTNALCPYASNEFPKYYSGNVSDVSNSEFEKLLGRPIPESHWDRKKPFDRNDTFSQLFYFKSWIGRLVFQFFAMRMKQAEKKGKLDLNLLFQYNLPFRGIAKMMGDIVNMEMADAIVEIFNGHFFKDLSHLYKAWRQKAGATKDTAMKLANAKSPVQKRRSTMNVLNNKAGIIGIWGGFKEKHPTVAQFLMFFILSNGITVLQMILMPILKNALAETSLVAAHFQVFPIGHNLDGSRYFIFNYAAGPIAVDGTGGGLAYFLAVQISMAVAQIINFFVQRKVIFKSNSAIGKTAFWYVIAYIVITLFAGALQGVYKAPIYNFFMNTMGGAGETVADFIIMNNKRVQSKKYKFWSGYLYEPLIESS